MRRAPRAWRKTSSWRRSSKCLAGKCHPAQGVVGEVEDVIRLVVRQVELEQVPAAVDGFNGSELAGDRGGAGRRCRRKRCRRWAPSAELILNVAGGEHRPLPLWAGSILDAFENSTLAFPQFVEEIRFHSKASLAWSSEDVFTPLLFQKHRGFSSLFLQIRPSRAIYHAWFRLRAGGRPDRATWSP